MGKPVQGMQIPRKLYLLVCRREKMFMHICSTGVLRATGRSEHLTQHLGKGKDKVGETQAQHFFSVVVFK